jgi:hypothetical protein
MGPYYGKARPWPKASPSAKTSSPILFSYYDTSKNHGKEMKRRRRRRRRLRSQLCFFLYNDTFKNHGKKMKNEKNNGGAFLKNGILTLIGQ